MTCSNISGGNNLLQIAILAFAVCNKNILLVQYHAVTSGIRYEKWYGIPFPKTFG